MVIYIALIYALLCILVGLAGRNRTLGFLGFMILSVLLTPFIVATVLLLTQNNSTDNNRNNVKFVGKKDKR